MKNLSIFFTLFLYPLFTHAANYTANNSLSTNWTDEYWEQYNDSLKRILFPTIQPLRSNATLDQIDQPAEYGIRFPIDTTKIRFDTTLIRPSEPFEPVFLNNLPGNIDINSNTNSLGAKVYEVPIECYTENCNIFPEIALNYNSFRGNGIAGIGWDISGISSITPVNRNIYYDGICSSIVPNSECSFMLDGLRLIKQNSDAYGINYQTITNGIRVRAYRSRNDISYFEAYYPDGTYAKYTQASSGSMNFFISKKTDSFGNSIDYIYDSTNNHARIAKISYNNASITFSYADRTDSISSFAVGKQTLITSRLQRITCKYNNKLIRNYNLSYKYYNGYTILSSINCNGAEKILYNPINFEYGDGYKNKGFTSENTILSNYYSTEEKNRLVTLQGRFDYYAQSDGLISYPFTTPYYYSYKASGIFNHSVRRYDNLYDGSEKIFIYTSMDESYALINNPVLTEPGFIDILSVDLDGKQFDNIIKINNEVIEDKDVIKFSVFGYLPSAGIIKLYTKQFTNNDILIDHSKNRSIHPKFYFGGDFDGDGIGEVLSISVNHPCGDEQRTSQCVIYDLKNGTMPYIGSPFEYNYEFVGTRQKDAQAAYTNSDKIIVLDCDGDGKSEICLINDSGTYIYSFNKSNSTWYCNQGVFSTNLTKSDLSEKIFLLGDFNGDGKHDILLTPRIGNSDWTLYSSSGNGTFNKKIFKAVKREDSNDFAVIDSNNDGTSDLIITTSNSFRVHYFTNNSFSSSVYDYSSLAPNSVLVPMNVNAYNNVSQFVSICNENVRRLSNLRDDKLGTLLTKVTSSLGIVENNTYEYINQDNATFTKGTSAIFPYVNIAEKIPVVASTQRSLGNTVFERRSYLYNNAVAHRQGLGFVGFEKITWNDFNGHWSTQTYSLDQFGTLTREESEAESTDYNYRIITNSNNTKENNLYSLKHYNKLTKDSTLTSYTNYTNGFPGEESVIFQDGTSSVTQYKYLNNNTWNDEYTCGIIQEKSCIQTNDNSEISDKTIVTSWLKNKPTQIEYYTNGALAKTESISYNNYGFETKRTETKGNNSVSVLMSYDEINRLTSRTDMYNLTTNYTYDDYGRVKTSTDCFGNITEYEYNGFGHEIKVTYPDSTTKTIETAFCSKDNPGVYYVNTVEKDLRVTTFYDALQREIAKRVYRFDGSYVESLKEYDNYGNVIRESLPTKNGVAKLWNCFKYDTHNRKTAEEYANGKTITYQYNNNSVTINDGSTTTKEYDSNGYLKKITTPQGEIKYFFNPKGQPMKVVAPDNATTLFEYDDFNHRTEIIDPSHGTKRYTFEGDNVICVSNDIEDIQHLSYDNYNRLTLRTDPEFDTHFEYSNKNQLVSVYTDNGFRKDIEYDSRGRIKSEFYKNSTSWLKKEFMYKNGNVHTINYTSAYGHLGLEKYCYENGYLTKVYFNDSTIYRLDSESASGLPTSVFMGSQTKSIEYDSFDRITRIYYLTNNNDTIRSVSYKYDSATSNMTQRFDSYYNVYENFGYDSEDRLTSTNYGNIDYDSKGNIISKEKIGSFYYEDSNNPYALSRIETNERASIPSVTQHIDYYSFSRPKKITESYYTTEFEYDGEYNLRQMTASNITNHKTLKREYLGDCYELDSFNGSAYHEKLYLGGNYYNAEVVLFKNVSTDNKKFLNLTRDMLGSVLDVYYNRTSLLTAHYDAWGYLTRYNIKDSFRNDLFPFISRGFTGHEYLNLHNIVNMNARLYDPVLGRFFSPDPKLQDPEYDANFNRYSYAYNNPFKYRDPNGELFLAIFSTIFDLFKNVFTHGWFFKNYNMSITKYAWKLEFSRYTGSFWQIVNKNTWGRFNTLLGITVGQYYNIAGKVNGVSSLDGMIALSGPTGDSTAAMTIGHVSMGPNKYVADWRDNLFVHEYGHYIQSQQLGPFFICVVGIPSIISAGTSDSKNSQHKYRWFERNASRQGAHHFAKKYGPDSKHLKKFGGYYFDINYFTSDEDRITTPYENPRKGGNSQKSFPI